MKEGEKKSYKRNKSAKSNNDDSQDKSNSSKPTIGKIQNTSVMFNKV